MITILGIDPGSQVTGYGIIKLIKRELHYIASGCIRTNQLPLTERLNEVFCGIQKVVETYPVDEVAVEQVFVHQNLAGALKLGQARGVAILAATLTSKPFAEYSAKAVKQAVVGYGAADKQQVKQMVLYLLRLQGKIRSDAADALAVAICHANHKMGMMNHPLSVS